MMTKIKKRRRRMTQVYPTEKPSIYVIVACMAVGVSLLVYFFNPYNQVTSPLPPQPESVLTKYKLNNLPEVPAASAKTSPPVDVITQEIAAPVPVSPPAPGELAPAERAPIVSDGTAPETNAPAAPSSPQ